MTSQQLIESVSETEIEQDSLTSVTIDSEVALDTGNNSFSSASWLAYFQTNKTARVDIHFPGEIAVPQAVRTPLLKSLQRFQIGETGEGKHLKKYASTINDTAYEECIDLFVKEEQFHARVLAQMIQTMDGNLLTWHWSEFAFVVLRRMLGLKTEIFILLIAEIIGKCFYKVCSDNLEDRLLSAAFSLIVLDEIGHLEFHCSFMSKQMLQFPLWVRRAVNFCWSALFFAACTVFIADHRATLKALNVSPQDFLQDCTKTFQRAAVRTLSI